MYSSKDDNVASLKNAAKTFSSNAGEAVEEVKGDLRDTANKAGKTVRNFLHDASDDLAHAKENVTTQIRTKPVQSSLVALGIGVILGALMRR